MVNVNDFVFVEERWGWKDGKCCHEAWEPYRDGPPVGAFIRIKEAVKCAGDGDWWNVKPYGYDTLWTMKVSKHYSGIDNTHNPAIIQI